MFSLYKDTVLDPFWGTGTTSLAAMISARNSIGYEINSEFIELFKMNLKKIKSLNHDINKDRLNQHMNFVKRFRKEGKDIKYNSNHYKFPVITKQERDILFYSIKNFSEDDNEFNLEYQIFEYNQ